MRASPLRIGMVCITALLVVLLFNVPLIHTLLTSLKNDADISRNPPVWVFAPTLEHYRNVLYAAGYPFPTFFLNSVVVALGASVLVVVICLPAAYSIIRFRTGGQRLLAFFLSLRFLPPIVFAIPFFILFDNLGLLDTRTGLILIGAVSNVPLALLTFASFIQEIPREIDEAARIDGLTTVRVLWHVIVPLMLPGIAAMGMLVFLFTWNEFLFALILSLRKAITVTVGSSMFVTAWGIRWGDVAAAIMLSTIPPLIVTAFAQRYLIRGLTLGALKG